jgi:DNA-binding CsgD family transcriptional regulator
LTSKQCQVLDLLIQHKTSKEISRMLGISPHTVDQRIMLARGKLQVATRSEVALAYRQLLVEQGNISVPDIYHRSVYGSSDIAERPKTVQQGPQEAADGYAPEGRPADPERTGSSPRKMVDLLPSDAVQAYYHVLPEAFDGRGGTLLRLGAVAMITVFLTLMILGGLAIYSELAHMLDS